MNKLRLTIPPPIVLLLAVLFMWLLSQLFPFLSFIVSAREWLSGLLFGLGVCVCVCVCGVVAFKKASTTLDSRNPDKASQLVVMGIYRYSRNPMYLGFLCILVACAVYLANLVCLLVVPLFILYLNRFQIKPEESVLT